MRRRVQPLLIATGAELPTIRDARGNVTMDAAIVVAAPLLASAAGALGVYFAGRGEQKRNEDEIAEVIRVAAPNSRNSHLDRLNGVLGPRSEAEQPFESLRLRDSETLKRSELSSLDARYTPDDFWSSLAERVDDRYRIECKHFAIALRQSTTYFYFSLGAAIVGFALVCAGVGLALVERVPVGTVTIIGGVLTDVAATLVFAQANRAKSDAQANLSAIAMAIEQDEKYLMAYMCVSQIHESSVRDATHAMLARQLVGGSGRDAAVPQNDTTTPADGGLARPRS
jgi:hypothetical protein